MMRVVVHTAALWLSVQLVMVVDVVAHGRLVDPPPRNSLWRYGYPVPPNYNDNDVSCGDYLVLWVKNNGKCGVCGDAYHLERKPHETGGAYARGIILRSYTAGQDVDIEVQLTTNHKGRFEMFLCPEKEQTESCFEKCGSIPFKTKGWGSSHSIDEEQFINVLHHNFIRCRYPLFVSGTQNEHFELKNERGRISHFKYKVRLPPNVTCAQCVMQWTYYTGNMGLAWSSCSNGTSVTTCKRGGVFRNCADVTITGEQNAPLGRSLDQGENFEHEVINHEQTTEKPESAQQYKTVGVQNHQQNADHGARNHEHNVEHGAHIDGYERQLHDHLPDNVQQPMDKKGPYQIQNSQQYTIDQTNAEVHNYEQNADYGAHNHEQVNTHESDQQPMDNKGSYQQQSIQQEYSTASESAFRDDHTMNHGPHNLKYSVATETQEDRPITQRFVLTTHYRVIEDPPNPK